MRTGQYVVDPVVFMELKSNGLTDHEIADHCSVHYSTVRNRLIHHYHDIGAINGYHAVGLDISAGVIPKVKLRVLDDGHGNTWEKCGPICRMHIVRPGKTQCDCD